MNRRLELAYSPVFELLASLHTYICRKSHKKIDLTAAWVDELHDRLTPELAGLLQPMQVDDEWKSTYLLALLCPRQDSVGQFLAWLEELGPEELKRLFSEYSHPYPEDLAGYRERTLTALTQWHEQYFRSVDPAVLEALSGEWSRRKELQPETADDAFVDELTNGILFRPTPGVDRLVLVPQYHFQPLNIIYHYDNLILCHYNSRIYLGDEDIIPTHDLRLIRSLGEKNRLKILRYLNGGPRTFIEIVRHLSLSKGITHDHLSKLRSAGLLYAHFEGENLAHYGIRKKALHRVQDTLLHYIEER